MKVNDIMATVSAGMVFGGIIISMPVWVPLVLIFWPIGYFVRRYLEQAQ